MRSFLLAGCLAATVSSAPVARGFSPVVSARQDSAAAGATVLAPARPGLQPVPVPVLDALESSVAEQIRASNRSFVAAASRADLDATGLAEAYGTLGQLYHAYDFADTADACYRNAVRLAPHDFRWLHLLGYLHYQRRDLREAVDFYRRALDANPDDDVALVYLGNLYLWLNRPGEARARFEAALPRFPASALNGLGETALVERRFAEALRYFEDALGRVPGPGRIHYSMAMAYRGLGRIDEARSQLEQAGPNTVRPVDPLADTLQGLLRGERVHVIEGRLAYQAGDFTSAAAAFARAVDAAPDSADARVNLGAALAQTGDLDGAIQHLEAALRLDAGNAAAHRSLGAVLALENRHADAVTHYRAAAALAPDDPEVQRGLARSLLALGREEDALEALVAVTSLDPADEGSVLTLAIVLADQERYREARDLLDEAIRRFPDREDTATTLARLLAAAPDVNVRDGARALDLAMAVYTANPTPVHGETVVLALAESGRCAEAADWQRRMLAAAEQHGDTALAARLRAGQYDETPCRPAVAGR